MSLTSSIPSDLLILPPLNVDRRLLVFAAGPIAYLALVRALRYQRRAYHARLLARQDSNGKGTTSLSDMSVATAQQIWVALGNREFPQLFGLGISFALFRTYAIPSISSLLAATGRLSGKESAVDQRLADTMALVIEFTSRPIYGAEWTEALARLNCIHEHYIAQGRILMDDMRYTLALFALEPPRWVARHDWRPYSDVELCATGVLWRAIGEAMNISWDGLASFDAAKKAAAAGAINHNDVWRDGLHFLNELAAWTETYEQEHMVYADTNSAVARHTAQQFLSTLPIPKHMQSSAIPVLSALMDTRLRAAVAFPPPSPRAQWYVDTMLQVRRTVLRHLTLPRPYFLRVQSASADRDEHGRVHLKYWSRSPFYIRPTFWNVYLNPLAVMKRFKGLPMPGPAMYQPTGYVPREIGPRLGRDGQHDMEVTVKRRVERVGTCPFGGGDGGGGDMKMDKSK